MPFYSGYQNEVPEPHVPCAAEYPDVCNGRPEVAIHCTVEGIPLLVCAPCAAEFRRRARENTALTQRCPRCEVLATSMRAGLDGVSQAAPAALRLAGAAAQAIEHAMLMTGILEPDRARVLARLAVEAPWLEECDPVIQRLLWMHGHDDRPEVRT